MEFIFCKVILFLKNIFAFGVTLFYLCVNVFNINQNILIMKYIILGIVLFIVYKFFSYINRKKHEKNFRNMVSKKCAEDDYQRTEIIKYLETKDGWNKLTHEEKELWIFQQQLFGVFGIKKY